MIVTLWVFGRNHTQNQLAVILAWGSVVGSALQVGVQLPVLLRLLQGLNLSLADPRGNVAIIVRNFLPVFIGRGVLQISAYIDALLASLLPTGAVAALSYAQTLYTLPVSLFGMSISAAELPVMSGTVGGESVVRETLRRRLNSGLRRIAFFVVPSVAASLVLGDVVVAAIYQSGRFQHADAMYVWGILAGASVGLVASTFGRLYASTYYALRDTQTPLRYAVMRVLLATILGYVFVVQLPRAGLDAQRRGQWNSEKVAENCGQQDAHDGIPKRRLGIAQGVVSRGIQTAKRRGNQADASTRENAPNVHRVSMLESPGLVDGGHDHVA